MKKLVTSGKNCNLCDLDFLETYRFGNGCGFPFSYKAFVKQYGYGRLSGEWWIYPPLGNYCDSWAIRSQEIKSTYMDDISEGEIWFEPGPDANTAMLKGMKPFAMSENGYYLFWYVDDCHSANEFDIFITDFRGTGFKRIAGTIDELLEVMTGDEILRILPYRTEPYPAIFECVEKLYQYPDIII